MRNLYIGIGAALVLLIGIRVAMSLGNRQSDQEQIRQALNDSIEASKQGRAGSVLDLLSNRVSFNSQDASGQLGQLAQFIKKQKPDITIDNETAQVNGDTAQISSPVTLDLSLLGQHHTVNLKSVLLLFHKEPATKWLIFPDEKWKLTDVQVPNFSPDQITY